MRSAGPLLQLCGSVTAADTLPLDEVRFRQAQLLSGRVGFLVEVDGDALAAVTARVVPVVRVGTDQLQAEVPEAAMEVSGSVGAAGEPVRNFFERDLSGSFDYSVMVTDISGTNATVRVLASRG